MARTLFEKIWDAHLVAQPAGRSSILYIDLHLVHEVTSPQAFDGLRAAGRPVRRPELTMATEDHNVPTLDILRPIADPVSRAQVEALRKNAAEFGIRLAPMGDRDQGIVHVIGPGGGQGHVIEYRGTAIEALSMEARMTICNMSIEAGARAGMIAPDETTFEYLKGRPHAPQGEDWDAAVEYWKTLRTDEDAVFDREVRIDAASLTPYVTWGTNPGQGLPISERVPDPADFADEGDRR